MAVQRQEDISFFQKAPENASSPSEHVKSYSEVPQKKMSYLKKVVLGVSFVFAVALVASLVFEKPLTPEQIAAQQYAQLLAEEEKFKIQMPHSVGEGGIVNKQIGTDLDTAKTAADLAREHAIKKIQELAGVVDTYAPALLTPTEVPDKSTQ